MSKRKSQPAPTWLEESVYEPKRRHSVDLVKQLVDGLVCQRKQGDKTPNLARDDHGGYLKATGPDRHRSDKLLQWQLRALEAEKQGTCLPHPS